MMAAAQMGQEMLGVVARASLIDVLLRDGVKVALPIGERKIDMLASIESRDTCRRWVPLKVVAVGADALPRNIEAAPAAGLLVALVWETANPATVRTFALTAAELTVVRMIALIARNEAARGAEGPDPAPTRKQIIQSAIEPFAISPGQWRKKLKTALEGAPADHPRSLD